MIEPLTEHLPMAEADPKPWWQSTTILGSAAVVVSQVAGLAGVEIDDAVALQVITSLAGLAGGLVAIWGRVRAVQPIRR